MQKLYSDLWDFTNVVENFLCELEGNFESPVLTKTLKEYCARVKGFIDYTPTFTGNIVDKSEQKDVFEMLTSDLLGSLRELEGIDKDANVFDIIDVLRNLSSTLTRYLPDNNVIIGYDN